MKKIAGPRRALYEQAIRNIQMLAEESAGSEKDRLLGANEELHRAMEAAVAESSDAPADARLPHSVREVINRVAEECLVAPSMIFGPGKSHHAVSKARRAIAAELQEKGLSPTMIGEYLRISPRNLRKVRPAGGAA